jgi:hypothetical protein
MSETISKYIQDNAKLLMKEAIVIMKLINIQKFLPVIIIALFVIGAYITYKTPSKAVLPEGFINAESDAQITQKMRNISGLNTSSTEKEGFTTGTENTNTDRCPNILIQHGSDIFLYNSKVEKVPGVNPIRFKSLDDYSEFMDWLQGRGIRCPVLFLQFSYDAQGNAVYKMRPSPTDLQGGLSPNVPYSPAPAALVQMMDASRDNPPFNNEMYDGFDPLNFNVGDYTSQDAAFREKELTMQYSDNPMDANWGGVNFSRAFVGTGSYTDRTRSNSLPMYVSQKYITNSYAPAATTPATTTPIPTTTTTPIPSTTSTPIPPTTSTPIPPTTSTPIPSTTSTPIPSTTSTPIPPTTSTPIPPTTSTPIPPTTSTPIPPTTSTPYYSTPSTSTTTSTGTTN